MSRPHASAIVIDESNLQSPFLGEQLFVREEEGAGAGADLIAHDSPFAIYEIDRAEAAESEAVEEEEPVADVEYFAEVDTAEAEQEPTFEEPETEADFERLIEAQLGLTGNDDRREVPDTKSQPYRWICSITYEKDGKTLDGGSGLLISNRHVLTAAHVITKAGLGEPNAPSLVIYPGRHYGGEPFGRYLAARTRVPNFRLDFGMITLNRPVDPSLLWWGHPSTNTDWWSETAIPLQDLRRRAFPITTAGFPGAKDSYRRRMYEAQGATVPSNAFGGAFRHTADTTEGQSGSPIWTERGGRRILIGIVTAYDQQPNQIAVFAHDALVQRQVRLWMAEDAPRPRPMERRIAIEIPHRWVCRLEVYDNDLRRNVGYGSGLLISNRHVLTSAQVIYEYSRNRRRYAVRVTPGYEFGKEAFGSTTASQARVSPMFSPATKDGSADYGLLTLSRPLGNAVFSSIGNSALSYWGNESHGISSSEADLNGKAAHIAAFSRLSGGGGGYHKIRVSNGAIVGLQRGQILHKASSKLDAPGAPIWIEDGKRRLLVGVASSVFSKDSELNLGCYLSQGTQYQLMQWINMDHEQTEMEVRDLSQDELELVSTVPDTKSEDRIDEPYIP
jgi:V8-like Glu-specific endopeptidase